MLHEIFPTVWYWVAWLVAVDVCAGVAVVINCVLWRVSLVDDERVEREAAELPLSGAVAPVDGRGTAAGTPGRVWPDAA